MYICYMNTIKLFLGSLMVPIVFAISINYTHTDLMHVAAYITASYHYSKADTDKYIHSYSML